jgi:hypothetical protein
VAAATATGCTTSRESHRTPIAFRIMAYDYTVQSVGPIAPMDWVRANVEYAVTVMDPAKLQIGVPTYGRARTRTKGGDFRLSGVCPSKSGRSAERRAYRSATSMAAVTASDIPQILATIRPHRCRCAMGSSSGRRVPFATPRKWIGPTARAIGRPALLSVN